MKIARLLSVVGLIFLALQSGLPALGQAVRGWEGTISIPTYKLGTADPNPPFPLINPNPVYPYTMLDDLTDQRENKEYRALYLENKYLKITILPQLGGHVYSIYDKVDHREVLYRNNVIKYGLVGPRGAWISGGMEFSFPFAHTTDTVSPVESTLRQNADGSATVLVGAIDWVSNMYWQIAITLRPDSARLEEGVTLFNATPLNHLYLFWTNTAVKASDDLQYIYPMRETISDDPYAIVQSWSVWKGVDQSWYKNNPSAIAIFGRDVHRDFFGVYYHNSNYGVVHVADFRQDPGKKLWSWGTAPSGRIWDNILSDKDGPYNEIQSGRFYTQGYREFMNPHSVQSWTEYWYPVRGLDGGFVEAAKQMAINISYLEGKQGQKPEIKLAISPVADIKDATVLVKQGEKTIGTFHPSALMPLLPVLYTVPVESLDDARKTLEVEVCSSQNALLLHWSAAAPIDGNPDLAPSVGSPLRKRAVMTSSTPVEELYRNGVFQEKSGDADGALNLFNQALSKDPTFVPALIQEALYRYRTADFQQARKLISRALQQDDENPLTLYASGLIYRADGNLSLAEDAFWASIHYGSATPPGDLQTASYVERGEIEAVQGSYQRAIELFQKAVESDPADAYVLVDLAAAERLGGNLKNAAATSERALQEMPLLPYALAEHWLDTGSESTEDWTRIIGNDPENFLAVASWYHSIGAARSSDAVLRIALANHSDAEISAMAYYYLASNARQEGKSAEANEDSRKAASLPIAQVFPNRLADVAVLSEAIQHNPDDAHAKYALGNFLFAHTRYDDAANLWASALQEGFNNPVLLRNLGVYEWHVKHDLTSAVGFYSRAIRLSPNDYRLYTDLDSIYEAQGNAAARANLFQGAPTQVLDEDTVRARQALFYLETSRPEDALGQLAHHTFKPWEGGVIIHNMFVAANMEKGKRELEDKQFAEAERSFRTAMEYPESLGTGAPAEPETAEQLYWLGVALQKQGRADEAASAWRSAVAQEAGAANLSAIFSAMAYKSLGQDERAQQILLRCIQVVAGPDTSARNYYVAGMAEYYSGDKAAAVKYLRHALRLDPQLWQVRIALNAIETK